MLEPAPGEPTRNGPPEFECIEGLARVELGVALRPGAAHRGEDRLGDAAEALTPIECAQHLACLGDCDRSRPLELEQLEDRHAQCLPRLPPQPGGALRVRVDVPVESAPMPEHAVHQRGDEATVAGVQSGIALEVSGERAVAEGFAAFDVAEHSHRERTRAGRGVGHDVGLPK